LEAHVRICDIRYEVLNRKHDQIEKKLNDLDQKVTDIYKILAQGKNFVQRFVMGVSLALVLVLVIAMATMVVLKH
jgi:Ni,Fe-hydrogenase III large subunit